MRAISVRMRTMIPPRPQKKWLTIKFDSYISSVVEEDVSVQKLVAVCSVSNVVQLAFKISLVTCLDFKINADTIRFFVTL